MNDTEVMRFAGQSMRVSSWVLSSFLKKANCYLIGKKNDGMFVFVFENPVTGTPINMSIKSSNINSIVISGAPSFSFQDACDQFDHLCDDVFTTSGSVSARSPQTINFPTPSFPVEKKKVAVEECNTTCPRCGAPAYRGFSSLECSNCDL